MTFAKRGVGAGSCGDLEDFAGQKWLYAQMPCGVCVEMKQVGEPACAHGEDEEAGGKPSQDGGRELRTAEADGSNDAACCRRRERVGEQIAGRGTKKLRNAAGAIRAEDRQAHRAFREVEHKGCGGERRSQDRKK